MSKPNRWVPVRQSLGRYDNERDKITNLYAEFLPTYLSQIIIKYIYPPCKKTVTITYIK